MGIQDISKLPGLVVQLVEKIPAEVEARVKEQLGDIDTIVKDRVEAVLKDMFGDGFDLSGLESAVGKLGSGATAAVKTAKSDVESGFNDFVHGVEGDGQNEAQADPAADGRKAADEARANGQDPVPAAAKAAHTSALRAGMDAIKAAFGAAKEQGAGDVEAQRHADAAAASA